MTGARDETMTGPPATVRFDPHVHTNASYDARGSVEAVLEAAGEAGLDAVAITDHDTTTAVDEAIDLAPAAGVTVVPGVEVSTRDGHLLALGVRDAPEAGLALVETIAAVRKAGGLAVIPHPFQRSRHGVRRRDLTDCDGVEVFNAWAMTGVQNRRSRRLAKRENYPTLGGSDAHDPAAVGRAYTELVVGGADGTDGGAEQGAVSCQAVLDAVATGRTTAVGTSTSVRRYLGKYTRSLGRQVRHRVPLPRI